MADAPMRMGPVIRPARVVQASLRWATGTAGLCAPSESWAGKPRSGSLATAKAFTNRNANVTLSDGRRASDTRFLALTSDALLEAMAVCEGDSGGPHFFGGSSPNLVVATTSTGSPSCEGAQHSQRLDTQAVHDWLEIYR